MYNKDIVTVITRQPDFTQLETGTDEKIRSEFERIFGQQENNVIQGSGPIQFEDSVMETSHQDCEYPNLNLNIAQRQRARDQERRRQRLTYKEEEQPLEEEEYPLEEEEYPVVDEEDPVEEMADIVTDEEGEGN